MDVTPYFGMDNARAHNIDRAPTPKRDAHALSEFSADAVDEPEYVVPVFGRICLAYDEAPEIA
jgi:hypothetical protein